jgi:23S rRNA pseudouridine955/2504/2580 synthase
MTLGRTPEAMDARPAVEKVRVGPDEAGRRLDNFLWARLTGVPRAPVYRLIRSGQVRVTGGRAAPDRRLGEDDEIRIPPVRRPAEGEPPALRPGQAEWLERHVIFEDDDLLVLDKPSGLAVHGGSGVSLGAIELLRIARPRAADLGLVHRLDRETSGCLLVSKRHPVLRRLQAQFREGGVEKRYRALVLGELRGRESRVEAPLLTTERRGGERVVRVDPAGKPSATVFLPEAVCGGIATLVAIRLETGRTHQIRVHAAHLGHPVAGDARYGHADDPVVAGAGLKRLFLHASGVRFVHPRSGQAMDVDSPLPEELTAVLARLGRR